MDFASKLRDLIGEATDAGVHAVEILAVLRIELGRLQSNLADSPQNAADQRPDPADQRPGG